MERVGHRTSEAFAKLVSQSCPAGAGVYGMLDRAGDLIYVGKSKSLRHRLMSYFTDSSRNEKSGAYHRSDSGGAVGNAAERVLSAAA